MTKLRTPFGVSKLKRMLHMLVRVFTCQNATLLEIICHGSNIYTWHEFPVVLQGVLVS